MRALKLAMTLLLVACTAVATADVRQACEDLVLDYAYYRDRPDADGVAELFTEDAKLTVLGETWTGRQAIHERIVAGMQGPRFRHMMSTIRIFPVDANSATGVSYVTVYTSPPGDGPQPVNGFAGLGEYHDKFVRTEAGWRIAERTFVLVFTQPVD